MVVTDTGMATQVGQISGMLSQVEQEKTPLTRQLDQLTLMLTTLAGIALALVVVLGLIRGEDFDELFLVGISLAVAAIPTGLPAVVTTVLSLGTQALAAKGAIVKRLRSVETLGATSAICSDKTGTLTLNQMTVRQLVVAGRRYTVDGRGVLDRGQDPSRLGRHGRAPRAVPPADGARERLGGSRGRDRGRPDRGGARRPRGEGRPRRRGDEALLPARGRGAVRLRVQAHGDVPRDGDRRAEDRPLLRQGRAGRPARPVFARQGRRRLGRLDRQLPRTRSRRERPSRCRGTAGAGSRLARHRPLGASTRPATSSKRYRT